MKVYLFRMNVLRTLEWCDVHTSVHFHCSCFVHGMRETWWCGKSSCLMTERTYETDEVCQRPRFTSQEDRQTTLQASHERNVRLIDMRSQVTCPQGCPHLPKALPEWPESSGGSSCPHVLSIAFPGISTPVSLAISPFDRITFTQLLSKPTQATTSSPHLNLALRYHRDTSQTPHTHSHKPYNGILHRQSVPHCLRCCWKQQQHQQPRQRLRSRRHQQHAFQWRIRHYPHQRA